ncbi:DUF1653 domain-containing protein [Methanococcoides sp. SA1]|nr:DUF1653 domain-containing protein [Methanococcoides sp. SA1]
MIIGITGTLGAGKGTVVEFLKERGFLHYSVRDFLMEEILRRGLEISQGNMASVANDLRAEFGSSYIVEELYRKAAEKGGDVVIESLRCPGEVEALKGKEGFVLWAVDADVETRYSRIVGRSSSAADEKKFSFQKFVEREQAQMGNKDSTMQNLGVCIEMADVVFRNDWTVAELKGKVEKVLDSVGGSVSVNAGEVYSHYKGGEYEIVAVARDSVDSTKRVVVYRALYDDEKFGKDQVWVREMKEFCECVVVKGERVRRFEKKEVVLEKSLGDQIKVKIKRLNDRAVIPKYAYCGDACLDVVAVSKEVRDNYVEYGTGLAFELPAGYFMLLLPRSSATKSDLILGNSVGVLDSGYRGELVVRFNAIGLKDYYEVGDRIAQIMILPYPRLEFEEVGILSESDRGEGRFGSSGR